MIRSDAPDILKQIVCAKKIRVDARKKSVSLAELERRIKRQAPALNFAGALMGDRVRLIAEIKKASPVKGVLRDGLSPVTLANCYAANGAAAISVLTNEDHFMGSIEDMESVQALVRPSGIPVLRKEFIFEPYQIYESKAYGADAILLIVAILSRRNLQRLLHLAKALWIQCLVEVHDEGELETALDLGVEIIGINNRNLRTFETQLSVTERLAPKIPKDRIIVSESGIVNRKDVERIKLAGASAILVGEAIVTSTDIAGKLRELT